MISTRKQEQQMKRFATIALMVNLAIASAYAQQNPVKLVFSGTGAASSIDLKQPGASTAEENVGGYGSLGIFTFRDVRAVANLPQATSTCSGLYFPSTSGAGVLRFQDGSLLKVSLTQGGDCIDLVNLVGNCTLVFKITGGSGRFKNASGVLTYTETALPVLADATNNPVFFTETGEITGTISGVAMAESPDVRQ
jgi:hypothetical protein